MSPENEIELSEQLYLELIGRYVSAIEVLNRRIEMKDNRIKELEALVAPVLIKPNGSNKN